ncbi:MAG: DUF1206 domain-containing protein [Chitinophagaceae bacterium]|nr:MAG: DUF1206 domain-containing protein [Chitinophagaceae bacterium]
MQKMKKRFLLKALTLTGCFSTGVIYGSLGVIALLSFLQLKKGGADESSFFVLLDNFLAGRILTWLIILGAVCFVIWRFYEAFKDPYKVGNSAKGIMLRMGAIFSSVADAFIAFSALQALFSHQKASRTGEPVQQQKLVAGMLENDWGQAVVLVLGAVVLLTAVVLVFYGFSKRFTETIKADDFSKGWKYTVHGLAYAGYLSRAVILGIIGFFFCKAAIEMNSLVVVNTDKAFDFIGDHVGPVYFILVAIGTICYGLYMFVLGVNYDIDADIEG